MLSEMEAILHAHLTAAEDDRDRYKTALERVLRVIDPDPPMPRPRDAVRDQVRGIVTAALHDQPPSADQPRKQGRSNA